LKAQLFSPWQNSCGRDIKHHSPIIRHKEPLSLKNKESADENCTFVEEGEEKKKRSRKSEVGSRKTEYRTENIEWGKRTINGRFFPFFLLTSASSILKSVFCSTIRRLLWNTFSLNCRPFLMILPQR
jgi:hypothetical protein